MKHRTAAKDRGHAKCIQKTDTSIQGTFRGRSPLTFSPIAGCALLAAALSCAALAPGAAAQVPAAPPPSVASQEPSSDDETIVLSVFEVDGSKDVGYRAENTLSGSRMNMSLDDVAQSVSVFTPQFIEDIGAESVRDILNFAANSEPYLEEDKLDQNDQIGSEISFRPNGSNNIRGQQGSVTIDYMASGGDIDTYNMARVELSQGPNAILFGFGGAGGLLNLTTDGGNVHRRSLRLRTIFGSWGKSRAELNANEPLIRGKLALRFMALYDDGDNWRRYGWYSQKRSTTALAFRPTKNTSLNLSFESARLGGNFSMPQGAVDGYSEWTDLVRMGVYAFGRNGVTAAQVNATPGILDANGLNRGQNARQKVLIDNLDFGKAGLPTAYGNVFPFRDLPNTQPWIPRRMLGDAEAKVDQFQTFGPQSYRTQTIENFKATLDHRLLPDLYINLAFFDSSVIAYDISPNGRDLVIKADPLRSFDGVINGSGLDNVANPFAPTEDDSWYFSEQSWVRKTSTITNRVTRGSLAYELKLPKNFGRHLFGLSGELRSFGRTIRKDREIIDIYTAKARGVNATTWDLNYTNPNDARNLLFRRHYFRKGDDASIQPGNVEVPAFMDAGGVPLGTIWVANDASGRRHITSDVDSLVFSMVNYWFKNRLTTTYGYRTNKFSSKLYDGVRDADTQEFVTSPTVSRTTAYDRANRTFGAVWRVFPWLALTYNQGDNQDEPDFFALVLPDRRLPPGATGESRDYGVRLRLLENRVTVSGSYFESSQKNVRNGGRIGEALLEPHRALWDSFRAVQTDLGIGPGDPRYVTPEEYEERNATGVTDSLVDKDSAGFDVRIITNLTRNWSMVFNYSRTLHTKRRNLYREAYPWIDQQVAAAKSLYESYVKAGGTGAAAVETALQAEELRLSERFLAEADETKTGLTPVERVYNYAGQEMTIVKDEVEGYSMGISPQKANLFTSYRFDSGRLKGLTTGGGFSWRNGRNLNRFFVYKVTQDGVATERAYQTPQYQLGAPLREIQYRSDDDVRVNLMLGYSRKLASGGLRGTTLRLQLNVDNVFQKDYDLQPLQYTADGVVSKYLIVDPRSWKLTASIDF